MSFNTFGHMFRVTTFGESHGVAIGCVVGGSRPPCAPQTAPRVAAGAVARKILPGVKVRGALVQMGPHKIDRDKWDFDEITRNPFNCPDKDKAAFFEGYLDGIRKSGSSIGAVIEIVAE